MAKPGDQLHCFVAMLERRLNPIEGVEVRSPHQRITWLRRISIARQYWPQCPLFVVSGILISVFGRRFGQIAEGRLVG